MSCFLGPELKPPLNNHLPAGDDFWLFPSWAGFKMIMWMTQFLFTVSSALPCSQIYPYLGNSIKQLPRISFRVSISISSCRVCRVQFSLMSVRSRCSLSSLRSGSWCGWHWLPRATHFVGSVFCLTISHYFCLPDVLWVGPMKPSSDLHAISSLLYVTTVKIHLA